MKDSEIRTLIKRQLSKRQAYADELFVEEVAINKGLVRADVVYCGKKLECFEIKSKSDTLKRLVQQGWQYQKSFERITLVCASKHVIPAQEIVPDFWGLWEIDDHGKLRVLRQATVNPYLNIVGVVDLMENDESRDFLRFIGHGIGVGKLCHEDMCSRIKELCKIQDVVAWAKKTLPNRQRVKRSINSPVKQTLSELRL